MNRNDDFFQTRRQAPGRVLLGVNGTESVFVCVFQLPWNVCPVRNEMETRVCRCLSWACTHTRREAPVNTQGQEEAATLLQSVKENPTRHPPAELNAGCKPWMLDLAQKMSKEIISQALLLCWEKRIQELPFIDAEPGYAI